MAENIRVRSTPLTLANTDVREMLKKYSFYCKAYPWNQDYSNEEGTFKNEFHENSDGTVTDEMTGLMWQKGQAPDYGCWKDAQPYIDRLNAEHFAGYTDWRLPSIEELATLMTRERLNDDLYVSPVFSNRMWFWSCDIGGAGAGRDWASSSFAWAINFNYGSLFCLEISNAQDIRAVRTAVLPPGRKFFQNYVGHMSRKDTERLMREDYQPDAELVAFDITLQGRDAIQRYVERRFELTGKISSMSLDSFAESSDVIMFSAVVATENLGTIRNKGVFYLRDGKICRQVSMNYLEKGGEHGIGI